MPDVRTFFTLAYRFRTVSSQRKRLNPIRRAQTRTVQTSCGQPHSILHLIGHHQRAGYHAWASLSQHSYTSISRGNETSTTQSPHCLCEPPRITLLGPKSILSIAVLSMIKQLVRNRRSSEILKFVLSGFIESTLETVYDTNVCNIV